MALRIVRGCFAGCFLGLFVWMLLRSELAGWPLLILVLSAISTLINLMQAITGPMGGESSDRKEDRGS